MSEQLVLVGKSVHSLKQGIHETTSVEHEVGQRQRHLKGIYLRFRQFVPAQVVVVHEVVHVDVQLLLKLVGELRDLVIVLGICPDRNRVRFVENLHAEHRLHVDYVLFEHIQQVTHCGNLVKLVVYVGHVVFYKFVTLDCKHSDQVVFIHIIDVIFTGELSDDLVVQAAQFDLRIQIELKVKVCDFVD